MPGPFFFAIEIVFGTVTKVVVQKCQPYRNFVVIAGLENSWAIPVCLLQRGTT